MSHIVAVKTEVRDATAIRAACHRLNIEQPQEGKFELFSGEASGIAVQLPGWTYPVVCDVTTGDLKYDNYEGRWGDQKELDSFMQAYAVEKAKIESRVKGHTCTEQTLTDGSIKLTIQVGAGRRGMKTIEIIVAPDGKSRVETKGFVGSECRDASRFIEQALGQQETEQLKAEFHATSNQQQQLRERQ